MALGLLWLGLLLLGALLTQAQDFKGTLMPTSSQSKIPVHPTFGDAQFPGRWDAIATADNRIRDGKQKTLNLHSTTYELGVDHSYVVVTSTFRGPAYGHCTRAFYPRDQPGHFVLENMSAVGRTKALSPELQEHFVNFAKYFGLTGDSIVFPVPIEMCIND